MNNATIRANEIRAEVSQLLVSALEERLQHIISSRNEFSSNELATYLRASSDREIELPSWHPLLNAAMEQSNIRGDLTAEIFSNMVVPRRYDMRHTMKR